MARRYQTKRETWGWNMALCEEKLLIGTIEDLWPRLPPSPFKVTFEQDFWGNGVGVLDAALTEINSHLRRIGRDELEFTETAVDDYARNADRAVKSERRRLMQQAYRSLDTVGKVRWIEEAKDDIAMLPPPSMTWESFKEHQQRKAELPQATLRQQNLARLAERVINSGFNNNITNEHLGPPSATASPMPTINGHNANVSVAIKRLRLATKPETIAAIIAKIDPDDALTIADCAELGRPEMIDDLVIRSLG